MSDSSLEKSFNFQSKKTVQPKKHKLSPQKLKSLMKRGVDLIQAGDFKQAVEVLTSVHDSQPRNPTVNYYLGYALHALGKIKQACGYYQTAVKEKPALLQGWLNLANVFMLQEKFDEAQTAFLKALNLKPDLPQALYGMGMAMGAIDKDKEASDYLSKAYTLQPDSLDIRNNLMTALIKSENFAKVIALIKSIPGFKQDSKLLKNYGIALVGAGHLGEAETVLLESRAAEPKDQDVIYNLARLYQDQTQYEKSLACFELLDKKNDDIKILSHMGAVLDSLGRFDEAEAVLQKALVLNDQDITVLNHLGNALTGGNKSRDAEEFYRKAIALQDDSAMSHNNLGFALAARGRTDEAIDEYTNAINSKPNYGESYRNLVTIKKISDKDDPLIAQMIDQIESQSIQETDIVQFGFALGKALDDSGDYDQAFKYYKIANDMVAKSRPFNVENFERHVDNLIEVYDKAFFDANKTIVGSPSNTPIFVVGMSRSGTTLAEKITASHPLVQGAGELGKLFEVIKTYEKKTQLEYPFAIQKPNVDWLSETASDYVDYINKYIQDDKARHVVDKMPYNFAHLGFIALALPNAKIIHCKRDPIDTCLSNYFQYFPRGISCLYDLDQLTRYYQQYLRLMAHWKKVLPIEVYDLQYEDLIESQEKITRELISFLDLQWDDACLQSHKSKSSVRTASIWQVRQPIYKKSVQRWRNYEKHIDVLTRTFGH